MSVSSINSNPPAKPSSAPQFVQTNPLKPRDPDHDGDVDKASTAALGDTEKAASGTALNIKA